MFTCCVCVCDVQLVWVVASAVIIGATVIVVQQLYTHHCKTLPVDHHRHHHQPEVIIAMGTPIWRSNWGKLCLS